MKTLCSFDNVACLINGLPDTLPQLGMILIAVVIIPALFATLTYKWL